MKFAWIHTEKASYPLSKPAPLENFFTLIAEAATRYFGKGIEPQLECEPGRGLVADCMSLLTRIKLVCSDGDDIFLLAVEDDGCGMPAEATPKGTGLGTKLIRAMAQSLHSAVEYEPRTPGVRATLRAAMA